MLRRQKRTGRPVTLTPEQREENRQAPLHTYYTANRENIYAKHPEQGRLYYPRKREAILERLVAKRLLVKEANAAAEKLADAGLEA